MKTRMVNSILRTIYFSYCDIFYLCQTVSVAQNVHCEWAHCVLLKRYSRFSCLKCVCCLTCESSTQVQRMKKSTQMTVLILLHFHEKDRQWERVEDVSEMYYEHLIIHSEQLYLTQPHKNWYVENIFSQLFIVRLVWGFEDHTSRRVDGNHKELFLFLSTL